ncbi:hypothetical protein D515_03927 [Grimontia indica]|uniref:Uncharacterized protein n=1 Tax=Grimontia indica TaxID=1056512 RepID=R1IIZ0_9GAMM|nr:hypothetical protein D515_03927 [Grimontia indica]
MGRIVRRGQGKGLIGFLAFWQRLGFIWVNRIRPVAVHQFEGPVITFNRGVADGGRFAGIGVSDGDRARRGGINITDCSSGIASHNRRLVGTSDRHDNLMGRIVRRGQGKGLVGFLPFRQRLGFVWIDGVRPVAIHQFKSAVITVNRGIADGGRFAGIGVSDGDRARRGGINITDCSSGIARHNRRLVGTSDRHDNLMRRIVRRGQGKGLVGFLAFWQRLGFIWVNRIRPVAVHQFEGAVITLNRGVTDGGGFTGVGVSDGN